MHGSPYQPPNQIPPHHGPPHQGPGMQPSNNNNKMAAGLCGIFLGGLGIHKFVMGYTTEGIIMLLASTVGFILTCGLSPYIVALIGFIEGIIYLTKSDQQFMQEYVYNKKPWF